MLRPTSEAQEAARREEAGVTAWALAALVPGSCVWLGRACDCWWAYVPTGGLGVLLAAATLEEMAERLRPFRKRA